MLNHKLRRGFTLVELMVVIVILGIIGTMAFVFVLDNPDKARWERARTEMGQIVQALNTHSLENNGDYPESLAALEGERKAFPNGVPRDPFTDEEFYYEPLQGNFELICYGKDGVDGGEEIPNRDIIFNNAGQVTDEYR